MGVDEVKEKLKTIPETQYGSMMTYENPQRELDTTIVAYFLKQSFEGVSFYFSKNQLKLIVFREPKGLTSELGYWIEKFEEPSSVILYGGMANHGLLIFSSYFETLPICLESHYLRQYGFFEVNNTTNIKEVTIYNPDFDISFANESCYSPYYQEYRQDWAGYGEYKIHP